MYKWYKVVDIIHSVFRDIYIHVECVWYMLVLVPKGNREFCEIGLVEVICKAVLGVASFRIGASV